MPFDPALKHADKNDMRAYALRQRRTLSAEAREHASGHICASLLALLGDKSIDKQLACAPLLAYRSMPDEVATDSLFTALAGRKVYAPLTHQSGHMQWHRTGAKTCWQQGSMGIQEPTGGELWSAENASAILICPLVGFDRSGNRLGLGKGCFDRWLAREKSHVLLSIGLAFACQECPDIPAEAHDIPLDFIITEGEIISCRNC
ncbi:MAG: 5-formyltetrahydrofolate cyclo-ligase [Mariprofundaceae bacterium]|nr:5-formyltetrahydrofolate cyclo-ligase [Mariprofundaceae bacterium]